MRRSKPLTPLTPPLLVCLVCAVSLASVVAAFGQATAPAATGPATRPAAAAGPSRWDEREANRQLNELVKRYVDHTPYLKYVETYDLTVTPDGKAREELFIADRLHFNAEGYKLLAERVRPFMPVGETK